MKGFLILIMALNFSPIFGAEKAGVKVADTFNLEGKDLVLNGVGIRRATFLNIKVYVGGLYLQKKSKDVQEVLQMPMPKYISMQFVRDVEKESLTDAWTEGFEAAVPEAKRKDMTEYLKTFNEHMGNIEKGQAILVSFLEKGVIVSFNGKKSPIIGNADFSKALFSIWFVNARDEELRDELLGKS